MADRVQLLFVRLHAMAADNGLERQLARVAGLLGDCHPDRRSRDNPSEMNERTIEHCARHGYLRQDLNDIGESNLCLDRLRDDQAMATIRNAGARAARNVPLWRAHSDTFIDPDSYRHGGRRPAIHVFPS